MKLTTWIIVLGLIFIFAIDGILLIVYGADATISVVIYEASKNYPVIPFAAGCLAGHLFMPVIGGRG